VVMPEQLSKYPKACTNSSLFSCYWKGSRRAFKHTSQQHTSRQESNEMPLAKSDAHGDNRDGWATVESPPLLTGVSSEDFRRISAAARLKRFNRGEMLYLEGDPVERALLLISGSVKITQVGPKGLEVILRLCSPGDVLDTVSLFSSGRHYTTAQVIRGCRALVWDAGIFKDLVESIQVLHRNMIRFTSGHLRELEERFRELATERVAPRVARQLIRLHEQAGSPQKVDVEIGLSRESIAQMTGTTLFTVSRLLSTWEQHGLVSSRRESVMVSDIRLLRKLCDDN
jgi:CRP/FNR family transcriptional regulator, nitrogen oxide reductase regulator